MLHGYFIKTAIFVPFKIGSQNITETRKPLLITQNGEAKVVVMDIKSFEEQEETLQLLKILALGNLEIEQKKFRDIESFFAKMDELE